MMQLLKALSTTLSKSREAKRLIFSSGGSKTERHKSNVKWHGKQESTIQLTVPQNVIHPAITRGQDPSTCMKETNHPQICEGATKFSEQRTDAQCLPHSQAADVSQQQQQQQLKPMAKINSDSLHPFWLQLVSCFIEMCSSVVVTLAVCSRTQG